MIRSFVAGVPAQVKGEASEKQIALLEGSLNSYAGLAERYKREGF